MNADSEGRISRTPKLPTRIPPILTNLFLAPSGMNSRAALFLPLSQRDITAPRLGHFPDGLSVWLGRQRGDGHTDTIANRVQ